jgi:hypothetical protein
VPDLPEDLQASLLLCALAPLLKPLGAAAAGGAAHSMKVGLQKAVTVLDYFEGPSVPMVVSDNTLCFCSSAHSSPTACHVPMIAVQQRAMPRGAACSACAAALWLSA